MINAFFWWGGENEGKAGHGEGKQGLLLEICKWLIQCKY